MNILDFLPSYPNIDVDDNKLLNPYDGSFNDVLFRKKEFYENKLKKIEKIPNEKGVLMSNQKIISRYMSSNTLYNGILIVHEMGSGKTCTSIGVIEQIKQENVSIDGAVIFASGDKMLDNFKMEIALKCTPGQYRPSDYDNLTQREIITRINKLVSNFYDIKDNTFTKFSQNVIGKLSDEEIINRYSNKIIVIDEVHNLRIHDNNDESIRYNNFHRFLHLVKNCKIILLSGTPMVNDVNEIASIMNLILPYEEQLPVGDDFVKKYMIKHNNILKIKDDEKNNLKKYFKGRVSYLTSMESEVNKIYKGDPNVGELQHLIVNQNIMSTHQTKGYIDAYKNDVSDREQPQDIIKGFKNNSREASLFVYPDGTWGSVGFDKNIKRLNNNYILNPNLLSKLKGETNQETIRKISECSSKYAYILSEILESKNELWFIYGSIVKGSGIILFSLLLQLLDFSQAYGDEKTKKNRYAILTGDLTPPQLKKIQNRYNNDNNATGDYIKVIIGSQVISEGFSFYNVQREVILTPYWNLSETTQAIARGLRLDSHNKLLKLGIQPEVKIYLTVSICPNKDIISVELYLYEMSERKDLSIMSIIRLIMESAFDCSLNYLRNHKNKENTRECNYTTCDYKCDDVDMEKVYNGLDEKEIDYSTYQIFYANKKISDIYNKISKLLYKNNSLSYNFILDYLKQHGYNSWDVSNSLKTLIDKDPENIYYEDFIKKYTESSVYEIIYKIRDIFKKDFKYSINELQQFLDNYTIFEILTSLKKIINENINIINKYGFISYLRETNNIYYLVDNISVKSSLLSSFYNEKPYIKDDYDMNTIFKYLENKMAPIQIRKLFKTKDIGNIDNILKSFSDNIQEKIIEFSIINKIQKKESQIITSLLKFYDYYIIPTKKKYISCFLENEGIVRCLKLNKDNISYKDWYTTDKDYTEKIKEFRNKRKENIRISNNTGIYGLYNPENKQFCLIDDTMKNEENKDSRKKQTGKVCEQAGWKIQDRLKIILENLKIPCPDNYMKKDSKEDSEEYSEKLKKITKKNNKIFEYIYGDIDNADNFSNQKLRNFLYWSTSPEIKTAKTLCKEIKDWFEKNNLLEIDNQCGAVKKEKMDAVKNKPELTFENFITSIITKKVKSEIFDNKKQDNKKLINLIRNSFGIKTKDLQFIDTLYPDMQSYVCRYNGKIILLASIIEIGNKNYINNLLFTGTGKKTKIDSLALNSLFNSIDIYEVVISKNLKNYHRITSYYNNIGLLLRSDLNNIYNIFSLK